MIALLALTTLLTSCKPAKLLQAPTTYKPGYHFTLEQETTSETTMTISEEQQDQVSNNIAEYTYQVSETLPDGRLRWDMVITRYRLTESDGDGNVTSFDSQDPDRDTMNIKMRMVGKMIGHNMKMTTTPDGEILDFSGANALFDKVLSEFADRPEIAPLIDNITNAYGDSAMVETVRNMWGYLPKKPVRIGDKWKTTKKLGGILNMDAHYTHTLKSRNEQVAIVDTKTVLSAVPGKPGGMEMGSIKITYDLKGKGQGSTNISQPDGTLQSSVHVIEMKGKMYMEITGQPKMDVPISTRTTVKTKRMD